MIFGIHTELPLELVTGPTPTRNPVLTSYDLDPVSPAGHQDQARRRIHARMDRAGHDKEKEKGKGYDRHCPNTRN